MHSCAQECILVGGLVQVSVETSVSETSDNEIGTAETGVEGTSESRISLLRGADTVYSLKSQLKLISIYHIWYSLSHMISMRAKTKPDKLMIKSLF